jgi:hypothetical protein
VQFPVLLRVLQLRDLINRTGATVLAHLRSSARFRGPRELTFSLRPKAG